MAKSHFAMQEWLWKLCCGHCNVWLVGCTKFSLRWLVEQSRACVLLLWSVWRSFMRIFICPKYGGWSNEFYLKCGFMLSFVMELFCIPCLFVFHDLGLHLVHVSIPISTVWQDQSYLTSSLPWNCYPDLENRGSFFRFLIVYSGFTWVRV
jgi:hypothetical protein